MFLPNGELQAIKFTTSFKLLNDIQKSNISDDLEKTFIKHRVLSCETHYIKGEKDQQNTQLQLIVLGKTKDAKKRYLLTYNSQGIRLEKETLKQRHLIYLN